VSARHALPAEVRLFDRLFTEEHPEDTPEGKDFTAFLNPESRVVRTGCFVEASLAEARAGDRFQFERLGYFCVDPDAQPGRPVFNRTVTLKDAWAKIEGKST